MPRSHWSYSCSMPARPTTEAPLTELVAVVLGGVELVLGDRAEVAEQVGGVDAEGLRVGAHALLVDDDAREVLGLLAHPLGAVLAEVLARPAPAGTATRSSTRRARQPSSPQVTSFFSMRFGVTVDRPGRRGAAGSLRCLGGQLAEHGAVERDDPGQPVGDERAALVVDDQAAGRLHDDLAHRLGGGAALVLVAADDLEVVEPDEERREQREHQGLDHDQAQRAAAAAVGPRLAGAAVIGRELRRLEAGQRPCRRRAATNAASARSQTTPTSTTSSRSGTPLAGSCEQQPGEREDRGAEEGAGRDRGEGRRPTPAGASWRTRPATYPTTSRASAQRPATWSAGGARSSSSPAPKPSTMPKWAPRASPPATTTSSTRSGPTPRQARCGKTRGLQHQRDERRRRARRRARGGVAGGSSQAPVGLDDGAVAGVPEGTTTPDDVEGGEVDVGVDHRALARCRGGWSRPRRPRPIGTPATYGLSPLSGCPR